MQFKRFWIGTALLVALTLTRSSLAQAQQAQPGTQQPQSFEKQVVKTLTLKYLLYLPKEYGKEADKKWPVMVFLHGSGERGSDLEKVKMHGPPKLIAAGKDFPLRRRFAAGPSGRQGLGSRNAERNAGRSGAEVQCRYDAYLPDRLEHGRTRHLGLGHVES